MFGRWQGLKLHKKGAADRQTEALTGDDTQKQKKKLVGKQKAESTEGAAFLNK